MVRYFSITYFWLQLYFYVNEGVMILLQEGGPLPGPEAGLLSNTRKRIV